MQNRRYVAYLMNYLFVFTCLFFHEYATAVYLFPNQAPVKLNISFYHTVYFFAKHTYVCVNKTVSMSRFAGVCYISLLYLIHLILK